MTRALRTIATALPLLLAPASWAGSTVVVPDGFASRREARWVVPVVVPQSIVTAQDVRAPRDVARRLVQGTLGAPLTEPSSAAPEAVALEFARKTLLPAGDLREIASSVGAGGVRFVTLQQEFAGTPVLLGRVTVAVAADGSVTAAKIGDLAVAAPPPTGRARLDPAAAREAALRAFGLAKDAPSRMAEAGSGMAALGSARPEAVIVPVRGGSLRGWRVELVPGGRAEHAVAVLIAADDGRPLATWPLVQPAVSGARVFKHDPTRPAQWVVFPDPVLRPSVESPAGWTDADETIGNNAWVELDRDQGGFDTPPSTAHATGTPPVFDFPVTGDPRVDTDAAIANVFWAINDAHDRFRRLGFDEAAGNCQDDNFQRGGQGGDRVYAFVQIGSQDGTRTSNDYLGTSVDGNFVYMAVGVFQDEAGELRDGAFETDLLYHELTHAASIRLVGGDTACFEGAQPQALSEGWSDFMAASFTDDPVIGAWTSGRVGGQREFPVGGGGWAFPNLCEDGCDRYRDGASWSGALWDVRALLILRHGRAEGIRRAERLVVEGMKYTPCRPTFVDARDGVLLADSATYAGEDRCTLWQAFSGRGIGWSTITTGPDDERPVGGFDMPPECGTGASVAFDRPEYGIDADARVDVVDASGGAPNITVTSSGGDSVIVTLAQVGRGPLRRAALVLAPGPIVPGDGILQVADGDTLAATHRGARAIARVSSAMPVRVLEHHVWGSWCQMSSDDDYQDEWYPLPGFLDAGENADIDIAFGHDVQVPLEDVRVTITSLNPDVLALPANPISLGALPAKEGLAPWRFGFRFRAGALPVVTPGEIAPIRFDFTARGRQGSVTLDLELDMDYEVVRGVSPFDGGVETFEPSSSTERDWSSSAMRGTVDMWQPEDCAGNGGTRGWRNGQPGCADYAEGQEVSVLLSPPAFPMISNAVAVKLTSFEWDDDVLMYSYPNTFCDADFVGLFVTTDPATLPLDRPEAIYDDGGVQRYWRPIYETTGGWRTERSFRFDTQPRLVDPSAPWDSARLAWIFWGDVYDCGAPYANAGFFRLDNVRLEYDLVRKIPETIACTGNCLVSTPLVIDPPGPKCPGEPFTLRADAGVVNCAGTTYYGFSGPGVPGGSTWGTVPEAPALGEDGGYYSVYSQCDTDTQCNDYDAWTNVSPGAPGVGGTWPDSLRVKREGDDLVLSWLGASAPPSYAVMTALDRAELALPPAQWTRAGGVDSEGPLGEGEWRQARGARAPGLACFLVYGRDPCSGDPRIQ